MASITRQFSKAARIILIGAPGVGKGTQTERLLARFPQLASISSGDLLRENVRNRTPLGMRLQLGLLIAAAANQLYTWLTSAFLLQVSKQRPPCSPAT